MRRSLAAVLLGLAALPATAAAQAPEEVRIDRRVVPLPPSVQEVNACTWTHEGDRLLCMLTVEGTHGRQVALVDPDSGALRCVTCAEGVPGGRRPHKLSVFPDGKRFLLSTLPAGDANADEGASLVSAVGACAPSLLDCDRLAGRSRPAPIAGTTTATAWRTSPTRAAATRRTARRPGPCRPAPAAGRCW